MRLTKARSSVGLGSRRLALALLPLVLSCGAPEGAPAQAVEAAQVVPPTSERVTIDLSAGMPGQSHWRYLKGQDSVTFATTAFDDSTWGRNALALSDANAAP